MEWSPEEVERLLRRAEEVKARAAETCRQILARQLEHEQLSAEAKARLRHQVSLEERWQSHEPRPPS
jgi:hypothetical protein